MSEKETILKLLQQEMTKSSTPKHYRDILSKVLSVIMQLDENLTNDCAMIEALQAKTKQYCKYVKAAEDNYGYLAELYKSEHKTNLDQQEQIIQLQTKLKEMEEAQTTNKERIQEQIQQMQNLYNEKFEKQKDEFTKSANKQAMGRKNIEEKLMHKDNELNDVKKRLQDLETKFNHLEAQKQEKIKEADFFKSENSQLKLLVAYLQPQQIHQAQQQAQTQQHIQSLPQPPHNPRY